MTNPEKLCVKELADALQVSTRYVYQMRACGFVMNGIKRDCKTSSLTAAVKWITETDFRLVHGRGVVGLGSKRFQS